MNEDLHEIQAGILKNLLFANGSNFSFLNTQKLDNNHFTFHIKRLLEIGLVEKKDDKYFLTTKGKVYAGKLDTDSLKVEKSGKVGVSLMGVRGVGKSKEYLIQQRLKEPFYGWWGGISGKVRFGHTTEETAKRELEEETGLHGTPVFIGIKHTIKGRTPNDIILDNYFFRYLFKDLEGELRSTREGKNYWVKEKAFKALPNKFHDMDEIFEQVKNERFAHYEEEFYRIENI